MPKIRVSQSSLRQWRRCRLAFKYKYIEELQPKGIIRPLNFGTAVHKIIEYHILGKSIDDALKMLAEKEGQKFNDAEQMDEYTKILSDAEIIMKGYFRYHKDQKMKFVGVKGPDKKIKKAEIEFEYDIGGGVVIEGVIDCIPELPDGRRWIGEHKSHKVFPTEDVRMADVQSLLYADAAGKSLGVTGIKGVMWDYIRSKSPAGPTLLKNGSLSKARIDTLPEVYEATILEHGLDPAHYTDILGDLDAKLPEWYRRVFVPINKEAVAQIVEETQVTGREMERKAGVDVTRNLTRDCSWCSYEKLCKAELFGMDADTIREREFVVKSPKIELEAE